jgi:hypothetical protein
VFHEFPVFSADKRTRKEIIWERQAEGQESRQTKHPQGLPQLCCLSRPFALPNLSTSKVKMTSKHSVYYKNINQLVKKKDEFELFLTKWAAPKE